jgi:hypothetical protein
LPRFLCAAFGILEHDQGLSQGTRTSGHRPQLHLRTRPFRRGSGLRLSGLKQTKRCVKITHLSQLLGMFYECVYRTQI